MLSLKRRNLLALLGLAPLASKAAALPLRRADRGAGEPIVLLRTKVNGEDYYQARESVRTLAVGDALALRREPDNAFDRRAIELFDPAGRKLGYVPRVDNPAVARMMDAGERMRARVTALDRRFVEIRIVVEWLRG